MQHSPLIGFAYDGFPIYGAYGFKNADGTGGIVRMQSSYSLRNITTRTTYANGTDVADGPPVSTTYPLGLFREDYEFIAPSPNNPEFLDEHNGRFCVTPEYPNGTYAYFCTVDAEWNSAYPYAVGPTFYGTKTASKVQNIGEAVTTYIQEPTANKQIIDDAKVVVYPNPASEFLAVQIPYAMQCAWDVSLSDIHGAILKTTQIAEGRTIGYFDVRTIYTGTYFLKLVSGNREIIRKVIIEN
jgi:hypothetical protein